MMYTEGCVLHALVVTCNPYSDCRKTAEIHLASTRGSKDDKLVILFIIPLSFITQFLKFYWLSYSQGNAQQQSIFHAFK